MKQNLPTKIEINKRSAGSVAPTINANRPKIVSAAISIKPLNIAMDKNSNKQTKITQNTHD